MSQTNPSFTVETITESTKGGFIVKLQNASTQIVDLGLLGKKEQKSQETYYIKLSEVAAKKGDVVPLDLSMFTVTPRPFTIPAGAMMEDGTTPNPMAGQDVELKWLSLKKEDKA